MGMDVDYVCAVQDIDELKKILDELPHDERGEIADDIEIFVFKMKKKYGDG